MDIKFIFLSLQEFHYSRTGVYLTKIAQGENAKFFQIQGNFKQKIEKLRNIKKHYGPNKIYVVMSPSHQLIIYLRILGFKKIVLDAGWPLSDALFNRGNTDSKFVKIIKSRLIDFLAFHLAKKVFFETHIQMERCIAQFALPRFKCSWIFTGFNEIEYTMSKSKTEIGEEVSRIKEISLQKRIVLYRGKFNLESGLDKLAVASFELDGDIQLVVATDKLPYNISFSPKSIIIEKRFTNAEISLLYEISTLTISLIGDLPRLNWTIPHKLFESAYFSRPILCPIGEGILEFTTPYNGILPLVDTSVNALSSQIKAIMSDHNLLAQQGKKLNLRYLEVSSQTKLARKFQELTQEM